MSERARNVGRFVARTALALSLTVPGLAAAAGVARAQEPGTPFTVGKGESRDLGPNCVPVGDLRVLINGVEVLRPDGNSLRGQVLRTEGAVTVVGKGSSDQPHDLTAGSGRCFDGPDAAAQAKAYADRKAKELETNGCFREQGCKDGVTNRAIGGPGSSSVVSQDEIDPRGKTYDRHKNPGESEDVDGLTVVSADAVVDGKTIHDNSALTCDVIEIRGKAHIDFPFGGDVHVFDPAQGKSEAQYVADLIKEVADTCPGGAAGVRHFKIEGKVSSIDRRVDATNVVARQPWSQRVAPNGRARRFA